MHEITITLPAIDESAIANIETLTSQTVATETEAIRAIREKYAHLARQNGYIRIASYVADDANFSVSKELYMERDGRRIHALRAYEGFDRDRETQNSGNLDGCRLYLSEHGEWIELRRVGRWSAWQGAPDWWGCGEFVGPEAWECEEEPRGGHVRAISDAEVAQEYNLEQIVVELATQLKKLAANLPERMTRVKQRADLASQLLASLK